MHAFRFLLIISCISFCTGISAQTAPTDGYANVDNNLNKVPRLFIGITPLGAEYREGLSIRPGAHIKYRNDKFGELQLTGTFTPSFLVKIPDKPFGPTYRCDCADNNMTGYTEGDLSYTYYFKSKSPFVKYNVTLKSPGPTFEKPFIQGGASEKLPGVINKFYGIRLGGMYQKGDFYELSDKRLLAYSGFEQQLVYLGLSKTTIGRMFRNVDNYGIKGKNIHTQLYADVFYALDQKFRVEKIALYDSNNKLKTEDPLAVPYGFRVGATTYKYGFHSNVGFYGGIEAGIRPTYNNMANGVYVSLKLGIGIGLKKTTVFYISNSQNRILNADQPNLEGNGKYKERGFFGRSIHKRKPLKMIRHRYGK